MSARSYKITVSILWLNISASQALSEPSYPETDWADWVFVFSAGCWSFPSFWSALTRKPVCQLSKYCAFGYFMFRWRWTVLQCFSVRGESAARSPTCWDQRRQGGSNWRTFFFTRWLICHLIRSLVVSQERVKHQKYQCSACVLTMLCVSWSCHR